MAHSLLDYYDSNRDLIDMIVDNDRFSLFVLFVVSRSNTFDVKRLAVELATPAGALQVVIARLIGNNYLTMTRNELRITDHGKYALFLLGLEDEPVNLPITQKAFHDLKNELLGQVARELAEHRSYIERSNVKIQEQLNELIDKRTTVLAESDRAFTHTSSVQNRQTSPVSSPSLPTMQLSHGEVRARISDYLDGSLDAPDKRAIDAHLEECRDCRAFRDTVRKTVHLLDSLPPHQVPPAAWKRIQPRVGKQSGSDRKKTSATGSPLDFDRLIEEYGDRIYGAALRITGSPADAEDVLQETFLEAYEHRASFQGQSTATTWLYRIAVNAALQKVRQRRPVTYLDDTGYDESRIVDWSSDLSRRVESNELRQRLELGIARLSEDVRVVVVLRDVEGLSTGEVGQVLDLSEAAVKSRLHRGRVLLRQVLSGDLSNGIGASPTRAQHDDQIANQNRVS